MLVRPNVGRWLACPWAAASSPPPLPHVRTRLGLAPLNLFLPLFPVALLVLAMGLCEEGHVILANQCMSTLT